MAKRLRKDSMTLDQVITVANEAYPDGRVSANYNGILRKAYREPQGDGLANFIVRELVETFDPKASRADQFRVAARAMMSAAREVHSVASRFEMLTVVRGNRVQQETTNP